MNILPAPIASYLNPTWTLKIQPRLYHSTYFPNYYPQYLNLILTFRTLFTDSYAQGIDLCFVFVFLFLFSFRHGKLPGMVVKM